jgi:hypothetical protein
MDLFSKKASFELVRENQEALDFHKDRFERGFRDDLARKCYTYCQFLASRGIYEKYIHQKGEDGNEATVA